MRRFELVEGSSSKFWEIAQEGDSYTVRYGRIGTNGQTQTKDLGDVVKAAEAVAKLIAEKTKKGYAEVGAEGAAAPSSKPAKSTPKASPAAAKASAPAATSAPTSDPTQAAPAKTPPKKDEVDTKPSEPGAPSAALLALAMPTRRFPQAGPERPLAPMVAEVFEKRGLVGIVEELGTARLTDPLALARMFATASDETWAAARARADHELADLRMTSRRWVSQNVGLIALLALQDDPAALAEVAEFLAASQEHGAAYHALPLLSFLPDRELWARLLRIALKNGFERGVDPATALCHLGPWVIPELAKLVQRGSQDARQKVFEALAASDSPEAAILILENGDERLAQPGLEALLADPPRLARAALTIATRTTKRTLARDVLERLLRQDPSLDSIATTDLQRAVIDAIRAESSGPMASEVPAVLAKGPWEGRKLAKPVVVAGLVAPEEPAEEVWPAGLREKWSEMPWSGWAHYTPEQRQIHILRNFTNVDGDLSPEQAVARLRGNQHRGWVLEFGGESLVMLRRDHALAFWTAVHPTAWKLNEKATRGVVAVLGADALEGLLVRAGVLEAPKRDYVAEARRASSLPQVLDALLPIRSPRIAPAVAAGMHHRRARKAASAWVLAHPEAAAKGLIPIALAKPGKERTGAEEALRLLASQGHEDVVLTVAKSFGAEADSGVKAGLSVDPLALAKAPKLPSWLTLSTLAPLRLKNRERLPESATAAVVGALCASAPDQAYAGFEAQKELLDETTLDELAWSLFRAWTFAGAPSKDAWAFTALAHAGGDRCVARLSPLVAAWPNDGLAARAQTGVEILGTIGTDGALIALHRFSQKAKTKGLKAAALEKMEEIAEARGLTADELADRLVPDLGLDDAGTLELDLGERSLTVGFDEHLVPFVRDEATRLPSFPKAAKTDDAAKHKDAKSRFAQLQKEVKEVAKHVLARLENAMAAGRGWPADVAESCFFAHPLMRHVAGRVAWMASVDERPVGYFRVCEDGTLATSSDDAYELPPNAFVRLMHPARDPADELRCFGELFGDYGIIQPFEQLSRPVVAAEATETGSESKRFQHRKVPSKRMFSLEKRGWTRTIMGQSSKVLGDATATLHYSPGIDGSPDAWQADEQSLGLLKLEGTTFEELDVVVRSELLYDVERLFATE